jgi:outer membrane protein, heavy metal efflux system
MRSFATVAPGWVRAAGCGCIVMLAVSGVGAQAAMSRSRDTAAAGFSLADAATMARRQHPLLTAAGGRRLSTSGAARQEAAWLNPVFEWRKENYGSPLPRDEFLSATLPVDVYGRRGALRSASGFVASRALADSATTARMLLFDIGRAYWRTALAGALHAAAAEQRAAIDTIARIESDRASQGAVPAGAALRARLEADRARLTEAGARAELERARADLARTLALPFDSVPRPTESLRVDVVPNVPPVSALLAVARARRSELLSARARVNEVTRRQVAERLGTLPALGVQVGSKRTSGYQTGTLQIGVAVPLFDRNTGNRERATGDVLVATSELRATESAVEADVIGAFRAYTTLLAEYERAVAPGAQGAGLRDLETRGATVATIAATAYREGAIQLFELLDAERVRADVRTAALRAAAEVHLARLDLLRAIGLPIDAAHFQLPTP